MKKIVFGITSLTLGGAERVLVDIANKLVDEYEVTIFTIYGKGIFEYELDEKVNLVSLYDFAYNDLSDTKKRIIPIKVLNSGKSIYKKYIEGKYDVQVSFLEGPITRIFQYGDNVKKIAWIHNDISKVFGDGLKAKIKLSLDKSIYKKYDKLVFVSEDNKNEFNNLYKIKDVEAKEEVIYNYLDKEKVLAKAEKQVGQEYIEKSVPSIITIARLVPQKAIDRLINVHKTLIDEKINHNIYVIGDGPERENLVNQIKELQVEDTFKLMGKRENPYPYLKVADYFVLLSKFEGYGMVIDEAKILNKNIIITKTAAIEAVKGYARKLILENTEDAIYEGLKQVLQGNVIFDDSETEFNNDNLINKIKALFDNNWIIKANIFNINISAFKMLLD